MIKYRLSPRNCSAVALGYLAVCVCVHAAVIAGCVGAAAGASPDPTHVQFSMRFTIIANHSPRSASPTLAAEEARALWAGLVDS